MVQRCTNPNHEQHKDYKGRWYAPWADFNVFLADMGECPAGLTIERIDNTKPYSPDNCEWATYTAQNRNRPNTKLTAELVAEIRQSELRTVELAKLYGLHRSTIYKIKQGEIWK